MMIKEGVWLILFNQTKTEGQKTFWLGNSLNAESVLKSYLSKISYAYMGIYTGTLPNKVNEWIKNDDKKYENDIIDSIFFIPTIPGFIKEEIKWFVAKLLLNNDYKHCSYQINDWLNYNKLMFGKRYEELNKLLIEKTLKVYRGNHRLYEPIKGYNWQEYDNFLDKIATKCITETLPTYETHIIEMVNTKPVILEKDKTVTDKLLEIECKLRNITKEELINTLISDTAKEIYDIIVE